MGEWKDLNMKEKREVMNIFIKNNIYDLDQIKKQYNVFSMGGSTTNPGYPQVYTPMLTRYEYDTLSPKHNTLTIDPSNTHVKKEGNMIKNIGQGLKQAAQNISNSLPYVGLNIPFDIIRGLGVNIPETIITPKAWNTSDHNQTVGNFSKELLHNSALLVGGEMAGGAIGKGASKVIERLPIKKLKGYTSKVVKKGDNTFSKWMEEGMVEANPQATEVDKQILKSLTPEYQEIVRSSKRNNTYLKNADGTIFEGDPREWIKLQSKNAKYLDETGWYSGVPDKTLSNGKTMVEAFPEYQGDVWTSNNPDYANVFKGDNGKIFKVHTPKNTTTNAFKGDYPSQWRDLPVDIRNNQVSKDFRLSPRDMYTKKGDKFVDMVYEHNSANPLDMHSTKRVGSISTDDYVNYSKSKGYRATRIDNLYDGALRDISTGKYYDSPINEFIIHQGTLKKNILGNNGMFDIANPNIYKGLIPAILGYNFLKE